MSKRYEVTGVIRNRTEMDEVVSEWCAFITDTTTGEESRKFTGDDAVSDAESVASRLNDAEEIRANLSFQPAPGGEETR